MINSIFKILLLYFAPSNRGNWAWHTHSKLQVESMQTSKMDWRDSRCPAATSISLTLCYLDTARTLYKGRGQQTTCPPPDWLLTRLTSSVAVFTISGLGRLSLLYVDSLPPLIIASAPPSQKGIYRKMWVILNLFLIKFPHHFFGWVWKKKPYHSGYLLNQTCPSLKGHRGLSRRHHAGLGFSFLDRSYCAWIF